MRVAITGPRSGVPYQCVAAAIRQSPWYEDMELLEGGAPGVDRDARLYCERDHYGLEAIPVRTFEAEWTKYGPGGGPIRNRAMIAEADAVIAIRPDWPTKGTRNCLAIAMEKGIPVFIWYYHGRKWA